MSDSIYASNLPLSRSELERKRLQEVLIQRNIQLHTVENQLENALIGQKAARDNLRLFMICSLILFVTLVIGGVA